jgi:hypothetical protein
MAKTRSHRPDRARAMAFPPTPAKASTMTVFSFGADSAMCAAILLDHVNCSHFGGRGVLLCDGFWCDAKPRVFGHPDALIIVLPDLESLKPISELC